MVFLEDLNLMIATKKEVGKSRQPPKLKGKNFQNLEYLADATLMCLTPNNNSSFPSEVYDDSRKGSYFEQCFTPKGKLGEGSFGSVIQVVSKIDSKEYAIKVSKEPVRSDEDRSNKMNEVLNLHQFCGHVNIVTLFEAWEEDRHLYLQMELCDFSLDLLDEPMSDGQCWNVLADIASALEVLHQNGVGHFDVKPGNIQLGFDKSYKLGDFGLSFNFIEGSNLPLEGDAKYLAPELLFKPTNFTAKADVFSLAMTVLELAGNLSLPSNGLVWHAIRNGALPKAHLSHISEDLKSTISEMLALNRDDRPTVAEILQYPQVLADKQRDPSTRVLPTKEIDVDMMVTSTPRKRAASSSDEGFSTSSSCSTSTPDLADGPSPVTFGLSPVKLSSALKVVAKANKRRRLSMVPRNLTKFFEEEEDKANPPANP